jgi:isocitrate lyase
MDVQYDDSDLCHRADDKIRTFQWIREAGIFHHLITYLRIIQQHFI